MRWLVLCLIVGLVPLSDADDSYQQGRAALQAGDYPKAVELLRKAIDEEPSRAEIHRDLGIALDKQEKYDEALTAFRKCLQLDPKMAVAHDLMGSALFKLGRFDESLQAFDAYLKLEPGERNGHWRRGITCYYAGKFEEGRKQFEGYEKVDTNDVENAVWHFLCAARKDGLEKARAGLLKIGKDKRVPMSQVYDLFAGRSKPEDVLKAAQTPEAKPEVLKHQLFYAHLYLGLYYEVQGDSRKALEHMEEAVRHRIDHYMGDVARVHRDVLKTPTKKSR
jgi:lipoprotein NlpI